MRIWLFLILSLPVWASDCDFFLNQLPTNGFPENGIYVRVVPEARAEAILAGQLPLSSPGERGEAFVSAFDDIADITDPAELATRLTLYRDAEATELRDTSHYRVLKFRLKDGPSALRSPIDPFNRRGYGFLEKGLTRGGAREWVIDYDANVRGDIEFLP